MRKKYKLAPVAPPIDNPKRAEPCLGIVYKGFNVKTRCDKPRGHAGYC